MTKPFIAAGLRRGRGQPSARGRQMRTYRRWTWRSLLHAPFPQLLLLVMVLCGLYIFGTSRLFAVTRVDAVGRPSLTGLLRAECKCIGSNIFLTQPSDIRARLNSIPWIDVGEVSARLPNRIVVAVDLRAPAALWRTAVATYTLDSAGTVLFDVDMPPQEVTTLPTSATVPLIFAPADGVLRSGDRSPDRTVAVEMARETRADLAAMDKVIAPTVDLFQWTPSRNAHEDLVAHSRIGWWFSLGRNEGDDLLKRLTALSVANTSKIMHDQHCNYVDLRNVDARFYCRYDLHWRILYKALT